MTKFVKFLRNLFGLEKPQEETVKPEKAATPIPVVRPPFVPKKFDPGATMMVRDMKPYQPEEAEKTDVNDAGKKGLPG